MYINRAEANRAVFDDFARPRILTRGRQNLKHIYNKYFLPNFLKLNLPFDPISEKTFYVYDKKFIDPDERTAAQEGRVAAKHARISKNKKFVGDGFCTRVEVDCYHEPVALLDPSTFKPTGVRPIHYLAIECHTGCYLGSVIDYKNGSELSSYVIELYKRMFFPKPYFQSTYGSKNSFLPYAKPYLIFHDGGAAFIANDCRNFLAIANTCSGLAKTQDAAGKPFIESGNFTIKTKFTWTLPGHYNDNQKNHIDPKHFSKSAVLTTLEHEILFNRFICDTHNNGDDKRRKFNRGEQWIREAANFPPVLPNDPKYLLNYLGMRDKKTIQKGVGIQFHVRGHTETFNSDELQKLERNLMQRKKINIVSYHRSDFFPDFIRVVNPLEDKILTVPRIKNSEISEILYLGDETFYSELAATQKLEILANMSDDEIIDSAEKRQKKISRYENEKKRLKSANAIDLTVMISEDVRTIERALAELALNADDGFSTDDTEDNSPDEHVETHVPDDSISHSDIWAKPDLF